MTDPTTKAPCGVPAPIGNALPRMNPKSGFADMVPDAADTRKAIGPMVRMCLGTTRFALEPASHRVRATIEASPGAGTGDDPLDTGRITVGIRRLVHADGIEMIFRHERRILGEIVVEQAGPILGRALERTDRRETASILRGLMVEVVAMIVAHVEGRMVDAETMDLATSRIAAITNTEGCDDVTQRHCTLPMLGSPYHGVMERGFDWNTWEIAPASNAMLDQVEADLGPVFEIRSEKTLRRNMRFGFRLASCNVLLPKLDATETMRILAGMQPADPSFREKGPQEAQAA